MILLADLTTGDSFGSFFFLIRACNIVDIGELNLPKTCSIVFPNGKDDLMNFGGTLRPDEGYYV